MLIVACNAMERLEEKDAKRTSKRLHEYTTRRTSCLHRDLHRSARSNAERARWVLGGTMSLKSFVARKELSWTFLTENLVTVLLVLK